MLPRRFEGYHSLLPLPFANVNMQELRIISRMREAARHVGTAGLGGPVDLLNDWAKQENGRRPGQNAA